jgi:hypothetical protein
MTKASNVSVRSSLPKPRLFAKSCHPLARCTITDTNGEVTRTSILRRLCCMNFRGVLSGN